APCAKRRPVGGCPGQTAGRGTAPVPIVPPRRQASRAARSARVVRGSCVFTPQIRRLPVLNDPVTCWQGSTLWRGQGKANDFQSYPFDAGAGRRGRIIS